MTGPEEIFINARERFLRRLGVRWEQFRRRWAPTFWALALSQWRSLALLCGLSAIISFVPFLRASPASRAVFYQAVSVAYPKSEPRITTILASDDSLRDGLTWPPNGAFHAQVLEGLVKYHPRALFMDMVLVDDRADKTMPDLISVLRRLHGNGTEIYWAVPSEGPQPRTLIIQPLLPLVQDGTIKLVATDMHSDDGFSVYPVGKDSRGFDSFAVRAFNDLCSGGWVSRCAPVEGIGDMEIWWAAPPARQVCETPGNIEACEHITNVWWLRPIFLYTQKILNLVGVEWIKETHPIAMPYHPQMSAYAVMSGRLFPDDQRALRQSIVIYGLNFKNSTDIRISNEVYGTVVDGKAVETVPGFYAHAMALDNLITLNGKYIQSEAGTLLYLLINILLPIILAFLLLTLCQTAIAYPRRRFSDRSRQFHARHYFFFLVVLILIYTPVSFFWFYQSPAGALTLALAPLAVWQFETGFIGRWLSALVHWQRHKPPV